MFERTKIDGRTFIGKEFDEVIELPDLIDVQLSSYESFLQKDALIAGDELEKRLDFRIQERFAAGEFDPPEPQGSGLGNRAF